jgi:hypothetical protein
VPDAKTLYSGDIRFIGGTPIVWAGPPQPRGRRMRSDLGPRCVGDRARPRPGHG